MDQTINEDYFVLRIGRLTLNLEISQLAVKDLQQSQQHLQNLIKERDADLLKKEERITELEAILESLDEDDEDEDPAP